MLSGPSLCPIQRIESWCYTTSPKFSFGMGGAWYTGKYHLTWLHIDPYGGGTL